ncbi:MAG: hypothetical protein Kow006_24100 [Gammaproteobacteria bacterium]
MSNDRGHLGSGVVYEARLPLVWKALKAMPEPAQLASLNDHNETVLRTVLSLEEVGSEHSEEGAGSNQELVRIEAKINLVLNLVGQLLAAQSTIPAKVPVVLSADALEWSGARLPAAEQPVLLELYLHPSYPRPLRLVGISRPAGTASDRPNCRVEFRGLGEPAQEVLEKLIFRHHRRAVAQARARRD